MNRKILLVLTAVLVVGSFSVQPALANTAPGVWWTHPVSEQTVPQWTAFSNQGEILGADGSVSLHTLSLFSVWSPNGMPIWTTDAYWDTVKPSLAASRTGDKYLLTQFLVSPPNQYQARLMKFSSTSSTPVLTAIHPYSIAWNNGSFESVLVSPDGQQIITMVQVPSQNKLYINKFSPNTLTSQASLMVSNISGASFVAQMSADGSTIGLRTPTSIYLWNTATLANVATYITSGNFVSSFALSETGRYMAYGAFVTPAEIRIFERNTSGTYGLVATKPTSSSFVPGPLAISEASSTLAYAFGDFDSHLAHVGTFALDAGFPLLMSHNIIGAGSYQNVVSSLRINTHGDLAVGLWGDQLSVPQLQVYHRDQATPFFTQMVSGSVYAVDFNDAGRVTVASKAVHANDFAGGGSFTMVDAMGSDFTANGMTAHGSSLTIRIACTSGTAVKLLRSNVPAVQPHYYPGSGWLYLNRFYVQTIPLGTCNTSGFATTQITLNDAVGTNISFQGLTGVRDLTDNWVNLTVTP